jgi:hypothetical protein
MRRWVVVVVALCAAVGGIYLARRDAGTGVASPTGSPPGTAAGPGTNNHLAAIGGRAAVARVTRSAATAISAVGLEPDIIAPERYDTRELVLRLDTRDGKISPSIVRDDKTSDPFAVPRTVELSSFELLAVAVDAQGRGRYATTVPDPLVLRAEFPDEQGRLRGRQVVLPSARLTLEIPNADVVRQIRLYSMEPGPDGALEPRLIGAVTVA